MSITYWISRLYLHLLHGPCSYVDTIHFSSFSFSFSSSSPSHLLVSFALHPPLLSPFRSPLYPPCSAQLQGNSWHLLALTTRAGLRMATLSMPLNTTFLTFLPTMSQPLYDWTRGCMMQSDSQMQDLSTKTCSLWMVPPPVTALLGELT